jgi:hypothetical protein
LRQGQPAGEPCLSITRVELDARVGVDAPVELIERSGEKRKKRCDAEVLRGQGGVERLCGIERRREGRAPPRRDVRLRVREPISRADLHVAARRPAIEVHANRGRWVVDAAHAESIDREVRVGACILV